jgi:hypothetical protein
VPSRHIGYVTHVETHDLSEKGRILRHRHLLIMNAIGVRPYKAKVPLSNRNRVEC